VITSAFGLEAVDDAEPLSDGLCGPWLTPGAGWSRERARRMAAGLEQAFRKTLDHPTLEW